MAIRTKYEIYSLQKTAPLFSTFDKSLAYVEFNEKIRNPKGELYRMVQTPELYGDKTRAEEYLILVYHVRRAINRYYNQGRKQEDLVASLQLESNLDKWNERTQKFIASHPGYQPKDQKSFAFCQLVTEWRKVWHERMGYRKRTMGYDQAVMNEMSKKCRALEKEIDKYVKQELQLL